MKRAVLLCICVIALGLSTIAQEPVEVTRPQTPRRVVTAGQIDGLYRFGRNEFRILALGRNKLKIQFNGEWMTRGGYPNIGEAIGEAEIKGNVAIFIPGDTNGCKITLTFVTNRMEVTQEGLDADCGFGHNVIATGTYRRIKGGKPRFIPITL
jgi:hypothetical protein